MGHMRKGLGPGARIVIIGGIVITALGGGGYVVTSRGKEGGGSTGGEGDFVDPTPAVSPEEAKLLAYLSQLESEQNRKEIQTLFDRLDTGSLTDFGRLSVRFSDTGLQAIQEGEWLPNAGDLATYVWHYLRATGGGYENVTAEQMRNAIMEAMGPREDGSESFLTKEGVFADEYSTLAGAVIFSVDLADLAQLNVPATP